MMFNTRKNYTIFVKKIINEVDSTVLCVIKLYYLGPEKEKGWEDFTPLPYPMGNGGGAK